MKNIALYIIIGVVGLAVVAGVAFGVTKLAMKQATPKAAAAGGPAPRAELTEANVVKLDEFVTNLADDQAHRYVKVSMQLVLANPKTDKDRVTKNMPRIRDAVVQVLNTKRSTEVTGSEGANKLKSDVMQKINETMGGASISEVLITDIVVQF